MVQLIIRWARSYFYIVISGTIQLMVCLSLWLHLDVDARMPIFHQKDNNWFVDNSTQVIQLPINKTRNRNTTSSLGYQPCAAQLISPRRLILACESKNISKNKKERTGIFVDEWLISQIWDLTNRWRWNYFWQNNLSKIQTLIWMKTKVYKDLWSAKDPWTRPQWTTTRYTSQRPKIGNAAPHKF